MKASHAAKRPEMVCTMFAQLQASRLGKDKPASTSERDTELIRQLMDEGVTFLEIKRVLGWLFFSETAGAGHWLLKLGTVRHFVNAYDTLAVRVDMHFDRKSHSVNAKTATGEVVFMADHIRAQENTNGPRWVDMPDGTVKDANTLTGEDPT